MKYSLFLLILLGMSISFSCYGQQQVENTDIEILPIDDSSLCDSVQIIPNIVIEHEPEFPGGTNALLEFIHQNLRYPDTLQENTVLGRVTLMFSVEEDGSITDIQVMRSPHSDLTQEAIRVLKLMPKWIPGTMNGKIVRMKYLLPFTFRLE